MSTRAISRELDMRYRIVQRLVVLLALLTFVIPSYASADVTPKQVDDALKKSKEWIYAQQKDGNWEKVPARDASVKSHADVAGAQWGGLTALCTYALLAAGESPQDERLAKSIEFLKKAEMIGVYAVAMRAQVWLHLPSTGEVRGLMYKDAQALRAMAREQGEARGMYDYTAAGRGYNHSAANYGVLGMWAAEQACAEVPTDCWKMVEEGWVKHQDASGGWAYRLKPDEKHPVTPGMTAAGLATLFITQDYVHPGRGLDCYAGPPMAAMEKGLKWLADTLPAQMADAKFPHQYATLYGLERVGVASGLRYFGTVDWYQG